MKKPFKETLFITINTIYRAIFARKLFFSLNKLLFNLSLRGLGILNYENERLSGEPNFLKRLAQVLKQPVILDVGANIGDYSNQVSRLFTQAEIYAFEPHPDNFQTLKLQAEQHHYTAVNLACSDRAGIANLYDYSGTQGASPHASLYQDVIEKLHKSEAIAWEIQVTTIDEFVESQFIQTINLLKIDTEGNELQVLRGAQRALDQQRIEIIQFEFNEMNVVSRVFFKDIADLLKDYSFYRMLPDGLVPLGEYNPLMWELFAYQNIVAIHRKTLSLVRSALHV